MNLEQVQHLCKDISMLCLGNFSFKLRVERDNKHVEDGRVFIQIVYSSTCVKELVWKEWHGRKFYLSDHMTEDEVIKTAYLAFRLVVEHEVMEGFSVKGKVLFNPHVNYLELLSISQREVKREEAD